MFIVKQRITDASILPYLKGLFLHGSELSDLNSGDASESFTASSHYP